MRFLFSRPLWFALARIPFRKSAGVPPTAPARPVCGQNALAHLPAGRCTMDHMGCELVAVYNALHFLGQPVPLEEIIRIYERRRWLMLGGRWGADPYAAGRFFKERGISCQTFATPHGYQDFAEALKYEEPRVFVLSFWLGDTVFSGAHAVTLVRRDGQLWGYNLFNGQNAPIPVPDLSCLCYAPRFIAGFTLA